MRRVLLSLLATVIALTGVVLTSSAAPAGAAGLVDLSAATSASPIGAVSPPGALAYYTTTFRNEGALAVEGSFSNVTTGGTVIGVTADGTCTTSGNTVTCVDTLAPGATKVVEVIVKSPTTLPATIENTATATVNPGLVSFIDLYPVNNTSRASSPVQAADTVGSFGFVREGESLSYRKHRLRVLDAELGVVAYLSDTAAAPALDCGGSPCKQGLRVDFSEGDEGERFFGLVAVDVNFGATDPCRGLGADRCSALYFLKPGMTSPQPVPDCGPGVAMPCEFAVAKAGTEFIVEVRLDSDDPDLLTPIKNLNS